MGGNSLCVIVHHDITEVSSQRGTLSSYYWPVTGMHFFSMYSASISEIRKTSRAVKTPKYLNDYYLSDNSLIITMDGAKPNPGADVTPESPLSSSTPKPGKMAALFLVLLLHHQVQLAC